MFSIIVPTYNRAWILEKALAAMVAMEGIKDCELIVIDDGSTDQTPTMLAHWADNHPHLLQIIAQKNAGPGMARNTGLAVAKKEYILFLDDDVFPEPGLLKAHARFLEQGFDLSQGMLTWHPDLAGHWVMQYMDAHGMQFAFDRVQDDHHLSYLYVYTANLALKRATILALGGFDPAFAAKRYAFEDTALAYNFQKQGYHLGLNRAAKALHYHPVTAEELILREYKVGYALGVLREYYPEIAQEIGLSRVSPLYKLITSGLGKILPWPFWSWAGKKFSLRLACREAFGRGIIDYEQRHGIS